MQEVQYHAEYAAILSSLQGTYKWGERDCVTTAAKLINELTVGEYSEELRMEWHGHTYAKAMAHARKTHGSLEQAYFAGLESTGGCTAVTYSDVALLHINQYAGSIAIARPPIKTVYGVVSDKYPALVFTDPAHAPWVWCEQGLMRCTEVGSVGSVHRLKYKD